MERFGNAARMCTWFDSDLENFRSWTPKICDNEAVHHSIIIPFPPRRPMRKVKKDVNTSNR
jgi:hypothetical protein